MKKALLSIRIIFLGLCILGSYWVWQSNPGISTERTLIIFAIGTGLGCLTIWAETLLRGFSPRGLMAIVLGLGIGVLMAYLIGISPLLEVLATRDVLLVKLGIFAVSMYLGAAIALRGKDDFNILVPYVRFVPNHPTKSLVILDASALMDGRIATICQSRFISAPIMIPRFVIDELHQIGETEDTQRQVRGRKGIETLNKLKNMSYIDLKIKDVELGPDEQSIEKLIYLARTLNAKLLTTDYNLAKQAEFHGLEWLNINALRKALNPEVAIGQYLDVELVKSGKETHQGVGYLSDGSMVVVNEAFDFIGKTVAAEVISVLPSAGGKMIFARLHGRPAEC